MRAATPWIRWFSGRGLPPAHIIYVLGCTSGDVAEATRARHGRLRHDIDEETRVTIGRLRAEGRTWSAIGEATGIDWRAVYYFYHRPRWRPRVPDRPPTVGPLVGWTASKARRLGELGYPADRIAELIGADPAAVQRFLEPIPPVPSRAIRGPLAAAVRRCHQAGESAEAIAAALQLQPDNIRAFLVGRRRPQRPRPEPPPGGAPRPRPLGRKTAEVLRLLRIGLPAEDVAEATGLDGRGVESYLARLVPRQRHPRRRGPLLNHTRPTRAQAALSAWPRSEAEDGGPVPPAIAAAELLPVEVLEPSAIAPAPSGDWGPLHGRRTGAYLDSRPGPGQVVDVEPPATAAAEAPPATWEQPAGWRSRRAGAEWRDD